jgi:hypothetical protein
METQIENFGERRGSGRYKCHTDKDAYVAVRPAFRTLGKVKDVSMSGIGFSYALLDDQEKPIKDEGSFSVDLFVSNNGFYLPKLKCRLAYDKFVPDRTPFKLQIPMRQCGIRFDHDALTDEQREKIELFLRDYTAGEA